MKILHPTESITCLVVSYFHLSLELFQTIDFIGAGSVVEALLCEKFIHHTSDLPSLLRLDSCC